MASLIVSAIAKWNGAALKKGQKDLTAFQKTTLGLAKAFAATFAAQKIYAFGKASVKAFMADEKAAKSLEIALKNTGNSFATIATEGFISRLQQTYKVLDDELRPAFQTLLTATGSVTESQKALELALSISAGTGKDLGAVSMALAKGFSGQTTALSRLGAGLSKATLASGDMNKIMADLNSKFAGQALAATKTYTGQMNALTVASANAKEEIGKGLLDSIALIGGSDGIQTATDNMENLGKATGDSIFAIATLIKTFNDSGISKIFGLSVFANLNRLSKVGSELRGSTTGKGVAYSPTSQYFTVETAERAKNTNAIKKNTAAEAAKLKQTQAELDAKKKALAEQANLDELKKKFDVGRINLETALANSTDEAEKARIRSLLTIMDEDAAAAGKRLQELDKANAEKLHSEYLAAISLNNLAEAAKYAAMGVGKLTLGGVPITNFPGVAADPVVAQAVLIEASIAADEADKVAADAAAIAAHSEKVLADYLATIAALNGGGSSVTGGSVTNNFTFNDAVGTSDDFAEAVKRAIQKVNRFGDSTTYAGAIATQ
jgi:hypothetical protein